MMIFHSYVSLSEGINGTINSYICIGYNYMESYINCILNGIITPITEDMYHYKPIHDC